MSTAAQLFSNVAVEATESSFRNPETTTVLNLTKNAFASNGNKSFSNSTTTSTTTETKVDSCLLSSRGATHVFTQTEDDSTKTYITQGTHLALPPTPRKTPLPDLVGKESLVQVDFAHFDRVLLRNNEQRPNVDNAAYNITKSYGFEKGLKRYVDAVTAFNRLEEKDRDLSRAEVALMDLINVIVSSAPRAGLKSPYRNNIYYLREYDHSASSSPSGSGTRSDEESEIPSPVRHQSRSNPASVGEEDEPPVGPPPRCIGVIRADSDEVEYIWDDVVVAFKVQPIINHSEDNLPNPLGRARSSLKRKASAIDPHRPVKKRRRSPSSAESQSSPLSDHSPQPQPLPDQPPTSPPDAALSAYALEMLRVLGNRRHALTVHVTGFGVRFLYYDRAGCIFSTKLNLVTDIAKFAAAFINISLCSPVSLGLEPSLEPCPPTSSSLISIKDCYLSVSGHNFVPNHIIHSTTSMYGRGTVVYRARFIRSPTDPLPEAHAIPDTVVVKMSWQMPDQESEDELYRIAAQHGVEGIPTLYCSCVGGRLSDGLRGKLVDAGSYVDRELRIQVMGPVCIPLYRVTNSEEFERAFVSLVQAHHDLYEKAGILHRDVSINNLMVDAKDRSRGILIDLDIAVRLNDGGKAIPNVKLPHPGTIPFRSIELLHEGPPATAYYRHDLESFFYVLVWILGHYKGGKKVKAPKALFLDWHSGDWTSVQYSKEGFLALCRRGGLSFASQPTIERDWLPILADLLDKGYLAKWKSNESPAPFNNETMDGFITFDNFLSVLTGNGDEVKSLLSSKQKQYRWLSHL